MKSRGRLHRTGKRTTRQRRTNKINGGYGRGCGSQGCPIAPFPLKSGGKRCGCKRSCKCRHRCGPCSTKRNAKRSTKCKRGGNFFKQGAPVPPPFVGEPWTANTNTWPGYGESNNHGNHLPQNMYYQDPKMMMKLGGKRRNKSSKSKIKKKRRRSGGASFYQNATDSYRDLEYNFKSAYNAASGYEPPVNPLPYKDQLQPR